MKKVCMLIILLSIGCAKKKETTYVTGPTVTQNCTVAQDSGSAVITCPDGTTVTLPPTVVIQTETVEVPVIVEVPSECGDDHSHDHGSQDD